MSNMTFAVTDAVNYLQKLDWEVEQYRQMRDQGATYEKLSYCAINAMDTAWHAGVWAYAGIAKEQRQRLRELLDFSSGPDEAEHFVGALSRVLRDLRLCRQVAVYYKHYLPTRNAAREVVVTMSSVASCHTLYTTATGDGEVFTEVSVPRTVRIPKVIDGSDRHRVDELVIRVANFWREFLNEPVESVAKIKGLASGAKPQVLSNRAT